MSFELPELPYSYDALAPYMSAETLEFHHDKHHLAYVDNGNKALADLPHMGDTLEEVVINAHKQNNAGLFNNAGQHYNHKHFWNWMKPNGGGSSLPGSLETKIMEDIGGFDAFRSKFVEAGLTQFGSGWCWLAQDNGNGKLEIMKTPNGESPLIHNKTPLLGCDVWEHSYYIDYRNARPKYLEAFVDNMINWDYVAELFEKGPVKIAA